LAAPASRCIGRIDEEIVSRCHSTRGFLVRLLPLRSITTDHEPATTTGRGGTLVKSRQGFTLIETLITVVVFGLIALIGYPKLSATMSKSNLRSPRGAMINPATKARLASSQLGRRTWIKFEGNKAYVIARPRTPFLAGSDADTIGPVLDFSQEYGATITHTATADSIQFSPTGIGGSPGNAAVDVRLARSGFRDSLRIDFLGRITK
jgi:prepilin-type N-terminal cleavage/methylation domain-containing protein